jgi:SAM-dependent methyltransferase
MAASPDESPPSPPSPPSPWVRRFARLIPEHGEVLDLACGSGRHARFLAGLGYRVEAVDRSPLALASLQGLARVLPRQADLEDGGWPYRGRPFAGIVVTNYLFRPRIEELLACLAETGVLLYETFMVGNERYGKPSNPEFLLRSQEMLGWVRERGWQVVASQIFSARASTPTGVRSSLVKRAGAANPA